MIDNFQRKNWDVYELDADEGFLNANVYPNPANATETRKQLQSQHSQVQDYLNSTIVPQINFIDTELTSNYYSKNDVYTKEEVQELISGYGSVIWYPSSETLYFDLHVEERTGS